MFLQKYGSKGSGSGGGRASTRINNRLNVRGSATSNRNRREQATVMGRLRTRATRANRR